MLGAMTFQYVGQSDINHFYKNGQVTANTCNISNMKSGNGNILEKDLLNIMNNWFKSSACSQCMAEYLITEIGNFPLG